MLRPVNVVAGSSRIILYEAESCIPYLIAALEPSLGVEYLTGAVLALPADRNWWRGTDRAGNLLLHLSVNRAGSDMAIGIARPSSKSRQRRLEYGAGRRILCADCRGRARTRLL